jgi:group I intron endonuclease
MKAYVYVITCQANGACYVGKTCFPEQRWYCHVTPSKCKNRRLRNAIRKYGQEALDFSIVSEHSPEAEAFDEEAFLIDYLRSLGADLLNARDGGEGGLGGLSPEARQRISAATKAAMTNPEVRAKCAYWKGKKRPGIGGTAEAAKKAWETRRERRGQTGTRSRKCGYKHVKPRDPEAYAKTWATRRARYGSTGSP